MGWLALVGILRTGKEPGMSGQGQGREVMSAE
jgi:hypothetical protein